MNTTERRQLLREALIEAAERTIETQGLPGLKARELAQEIGCAVGAIYNLVADLDELVLAVNSRTLAMLGRAARPEDRNGSDAMARTPEQAIELLVHLGLIYLDFVAANRL